MKLDQNCSDCRGGPAGSPITSTRVLPSIGFNHDGSAVWDTRIVSCDRLDELDVYLAVDAYYQQVDCRYRVRVGNTTRWCYQNGDGSNLNPSPANDPPPIAGMIMMPFPGWAAWFVRPRKWRPCVGSVGLAPQRRKTTPSTTGFKTVRLSSTSSMATMYATELR